MQVDRATTKDLSILEPGEDGTTLFALLDRTRTNLGSRALRSRMRALPAGAELQRTQDAVRHLSTRLGWTPSAVESVDPDAVDDYLALKWQALSKRSRAGQLIERVTLRLGFRDAIRQISRGAGSLHVLLEGLQRVVDSIAPGPAVLEEYAGRLSELAEAGVLPEVRRYAKARSLADVLDADHLARGRGRESIRDILNVLADLDALCALASATVEHEWCFPDIVEADGVMDISGLRHAFLPGGVANDIHMSGQRRVLAVTGPNMAGKSTLLKAAGVAVYLTHLGCGVPASRARVSRFDSLLASLYVRDSLSNGQSFYLNEVRRIKDLTSLLESTPRVFALLDEPFKGTNVHDASEATALLLDGLCAQVASTIIIATHLSAVVRSRSHDQCLATGYLGASDGESGPVFDYQLRPGVSDQRLGMVLLEREGVAPALASAIERRAQRLGARTGPDQIHSGA
jgi:DNA mismatch repair ATPase MutS